jgi:hypothetical protein
MFGENPFRVRENPVSIEAAKRNAMCRSLEASAKKLMSLGALLASANGIMGCTYTLAPKHAPEESIRTDQSHVLDAKHRAREILLAAAEGGVQADEALHDARVRKAKIQRERHGSEVVAELFPILEGLESLDIDRELMESYLKTYPRTWVDRTNVDRVSFQPRLMPIAYRGAIHGETMAAQARVDGQHSVIDIMHLALVDTNSDKRDQATRDIFVVTFPHELVHTKDWSTSPEITSAQSAELVSEVRKLSLAEGRPKLGDFEYPEKISLEDLSNRLAEYYAVLMSYAMQHRNDAVHTWDEWEKSFMAWLRVEVGADEVQAKANAQLVRKYFTWTDPDFAIWDAAQERAHVADHIIEEQQFRQSKRALGRLEDVRLKNQLFALLEIEHEEIPQKFLEFYKRMAFADFTGDDDRLKKDWESTKRTLSKGMQVPQAAQERLAEVFLEMTKFIDVVIRTRTAHWWQESLRSDTRIEQKDVEQFHSQMSSLPPEFQSVIRSQLGKYLHWLVSSPPVLKQSPK